MKGICRPGWVGSRDRSVFHVCHVFSSFFRRLRVLNRAARPTRAQLSMGFLEDFGLWEARRNSATHSVIQRRWPTLSVIRRHPPTLTDKKYRIKNLTGFLKPQMDSSGQE